ncbi:MAG: ribosome biogenesis GTPase YlqF, partial [Nitrospiria bacterium]
MTIQWYPGHMHKARKEIQAAMPQIDLVIEVMDARIPFSSENPLVSALRGNRPAIKVLNKSDLADPKITKDWLQHLEREKGVKAQAMMATEIRSIRKLLSLCRDLFPERNKKTKPLRVMILGIPNSGKSTLINTLVGKGVAKVRDEPAVTRHQQQVNLGNGIFLHDTPGILWPRFEDQKSGFRLALTGAIKNTVTDPEAVAVFAAKFFLEAYPEALKTRYKIKSLPEQPATLLEIIGRKRGCLQPGGLIDLYKASEVLLTDFKSGALGRISLETPETA